LGIDLVTLCVNPLEKTDFKNGFTGVKPSCFNKNIYRYYNAISSFDKMKMVSYYTKQFLSNPGYLNASIFDTIFAYVSYYSIPHNYLFLYKYIKWDENEIISTLRKEYDWELATDTKNTWRIGDGTAPFYNYIYYTIAGFTENDTFRSNQIREGLITREQALKLTQEDNRPREESIKWYCDAIGINFEDVLKSLKAAPKLYDER